MLCFTFNSLNQWSKALSSHHISVAITHFKALYGWDPPTLTRYHGSSKDPPGLQSQLQQREELLIQLQANLHKAQQYMKVHTDKNADMWSLILVIMFSSNCSLTAKIIFLFASIRNLICVISVPFRLLPALALLHTA